MEVVAVRLSSSSRIRSCDAAGLPLEVGDRCIVEAEAGLEFGTVVGPPLANPLFPPSARLPRVARRATVADEEAYARKDAAEREAAAYCAARVRERGLAMRIGKVDQSFDAKRLIVHFTAEGRIDFRDLVRDLSGRFNVRVDLRQIGEREDAGVRGGVGPCGRMLCCSSFLSRFDPISIKMAKAQGLSLNPSKISGMCGRLMCCLKYEYDPDARPPKKGGPKPVEGESGPSGDLPVLS